MPRPSTSNPAPRVRHGIAKTSAIVWCAANSAAGDTPVKHHVFGHPALVREGLQALRVRSATDYHQHGTVDAAFAPPTTPG